MTNQVTPEALAAIQAREANVHAEMCVLVAAQTNAPCSCDAKVALTVSERDRLVQGYRTPAPPSEMPQLTPKEVIASVVREHGDECFIAEGYGAHDDLVMWMNRMLESQPAAQVAENGRLRQEIERLRRIVLDAAVSRVTPDVGESVPKLPLPDGATKEPV